MKKSELKKIVIECKKELVKEGPEQAKSKKAPLKAWVMFDRIIQMMSKKSKFITNVGRKRVMGGKFVHEFKMYGDFTFYVISDFDFKSLTSRFNEKSEETNEAAFTNPGLEKKYQEKKKK